MYYELVVGMSACDQIQCVPDLEHCRRVRNITCLIVTRFLCKRALYHISNALLIVCDISHHECEMCVRVCATWNQQRMMWDVTYISHSWCEMSHTISGSTHTHTHARAWAHARNKTVPKHSYVYTCRFNAWWCLCIYVHVYVILMIFMYICDIYVIFKYICTDIWCVHIYMYIYICTYVYLCIYVIFQYTCTDIWYVHIYMYIYICTYIYVYMWYLSILVQIYDMYIWYIHIYMYIYICTYVYVYMWYLSIHVQIYDMYIYICTYIYVHMYVHMYTHMCVHMYTHMCVHMYTQLRMWNHRSDLSTRRLTIIIVCKIVHTYNLYIYSVCST